MSQPNSATIKRIHRESLEFVRDSSPDISARPVSDSDLFNWHFTIRGPPAPSPYARGIYHGRIALPPNYPLRPPSIRFSTPSGRFIVNDEICLTISTHHEETWQPAWGIRKALLAIRALMDAEVDGQLGGLECSAEARLMLAEESRARWCRECGKTNDQMLAQQRETHKATVWALKHGPGNVLGRAAAVTAAAGNGESSAATITAATTGNGDAPYAPNVFPSRTASSHLRLDQQSPRNQQTSGLDWMIGGFLIFLMLMVYNKYA